MGEAALEAPDQPRLVDFGLTDEDLESVPELRIGPKRALFVVAIYGTATALVFLATLALSGSVIGAVFFGVLLMAAGSVLLVPAITGMVCALEHCEHCWLCRRHARYRAVSEYRKALSKHELEMARFRAARSRSEESFWLGLDDAALVAETSRMLGDAGRGVELMAAEADAGIDLATTGEGRITAVRCVAGREVTGRSFGRELVAAARDIDAADVLLVAPWGVSSDLSGYLEDHGVRVLDSAALVGMDARLHH